MHTQLPFVAIADGQPLEGEFEANRIICIGRNYADHTQEMGHDPKNTSPMFFFKPLTALNQSKYFTRPGFSSEVHHELELVVAITQFGQALTPDTAGACVGGYALGLDMTCRDIQRAAKESGQPWDLAKGFDGSAICSPIARGEFSDLLRMGPLTLKKNGTVVQSCHWQDMVWSVPELLTHVSQFVALVPGDLIYTGTPAGVGEVREGDHLEAYMEGLPVRLDVHVV